MSTLRIEHRHALSAEETRTRMTALGEYLKNKYGLDVSWNGDSARVKGKYLVVEIDGSIILEPGLLRFEGKDPGMLWRSKAKQYLEKKVSTYMDPGTKVEDLRRA